MSSTSLKHKTFIMEPMGEKLITTLPGINRQRGTQLKKEGFDKAFMVLGQFLLLRKNEELFKEWLTYICEANSRQASQCFKCLMDWCDAFL
ncbi:barrier-to-autointegration factor A-like [Lampetra fluviatilis]